MVCPTLWYTHTYMYILHHLHVCTCIYACMGLYRVHRTYVTQHWVGGPHTKGNKMITSRHQCVCVCVWSGVVSLQAYVHVLTYILVADHSLSSHFVLVPSWLIANRGVTNFKRCYICTYNISLAVGGALATCTVYLAVLQMTKELFGENILAGAIRYGVLLGRATIPRMVAHLWPLLPSWSRKCSRRPFEQL